MQVNPTENKVLTLPSAADWAVFYRNLHKEVNLDLSLYKADQMQRRILNMVDNLKLGNLEEFWKSLITEPGRMQWFLDKIAINVSELFRNPEKWREFESTVLPKLLSDRKSLKIWSAGCSYGAEAYTIAAILDTKFPGQHKILGTDIDSVALAQAQRGEFNEADMRNVPPQIKSSLFEQSGVTYRAGMNLRKYMTFTKQNMLADRFDSGFDLIVCRNVVIYFTEEAKDKLYGKFIDALAPGGVLFVGSTERILNANVLGYEQLLPFFYRKPNQAEKKWLNAS